MNTFKISYRYMDKKSKNKKWMYDICLCLCCFDIDYALNKFKKLRWCNDNKFEILGIEIIGEQ